VTSRGRHALSRMHPPPSHALTCTTGTRSLQSDVVHFDKDLTMNAALRRKSILDLPPSVTVVRAAAGAAKTMNTMRPIAAQIAFSINKVFALVEKASKQPCKIEKEFASLWLCEWRLAPFPGTLDCKILRCRVLHAPASSKPHSCTRAGRGGMVWSVLTSPGGNAARAPLQWAWWMTPSLWAYPAPQACE